jgi:hypothetical protein
MGFPFLILSICAAIWASSGEAYGAQYVVDGFDEDACPDYTTYSSYQQ